tara:strand:- start:294 stop:620 length:327 start_codon:yes stop_codon:yes gene_type:complete
MNTLDKRVLVEGAITDDVTYGDKGQILKPIKANSIAEERKIDELMSRYPNLDYLMCLLLVQATDEELQELITTAKPRQLDTSTIIKQDFLLPEEDKEEEPKINNLVIN